MNKDEKRELRRKRLIDNKAYQTMNDLTRYMDRYYLDALIGIIPGWGDAITLLSVVPFVYFSSRVIKSIPLTLAVPAPGIKKEYCRVAINDEGNITIAIENKQENKHEDKHHHYLRREFSYSNYEQSYTLPDDVVKDQISAKVEDGILTVTMPKTEPKQKVTKAIEVS